MLGPGNPDWLLASPLAVRLFHDHAAGLPLLDYHNHLSAADLDADRRFANLTELWIRHDPYKHRAMRMLGVPESEITGAGDDRRLFDLWAAAVPQLLGNPLHHWTALELQRALGISDPLNAASASDIWDRAQSALRDASRSARGLLNGTKTQTVCTSNLLLEDLSHHLSLRGLSNPGAGGTGGAGEATGLGVLPSLRADDIFTVGTEVGRRWCDELSASTEIAIRDFDAFGAAVEQRLDVFERAGACIADHALDAVSFTEVTLNETRTHFDRWLRGSLETIDQTRLHTGLMVMCGQSYVRRGWSMLLHIGAQRQTSSRLRRLAGPAGGYAALGTPTRIDALAGLLDLLERRDALPRTVLFNLNPADNAAFATLTGSFARDGQPGHLTWGPAWWFNDHLHGITNHLDLTANYSLLSVFPGMTTDSRSLLSMHRHEYFRRILCDWLARQVAGGLMPDDEPALAQLLRQMLYDNPLRLLNPRTSSNDSTGTNHE